MPHSPLFAMLGSSGHVLKAALRCATMTLSTYPVSLLCLLLAPLSWSGSLCRPGPSAKLDFSATVNTRPGSSTPVVRAGDQVVVGYRLANSGSSRLVDVRIAEPDAVGGTVSCSGGGPSVVLRRGAGVDCVVRVTASAGMHVGTAVATAGVDDDDDGDDMGDDVGDGGHGGDQRQVSVSAAVGYQGIASSLNVADHVSMSPDSSGAQVTVAYVVTNTGNAALFDFAVADAVLPSGAMCPSAGTGLTPGASLTCTGTGHLKPGAYQSSATGSADDRTTTVGPDGQSVPPPRVAANASARFSVVALPPPAPPPSPSSSSPAPPPTTSAPPSPIPRSTPPPASVPPPPPTTLPAPTPTSPAPVPPPSSPPLTPPPSPSPTTAAPRQPPSQAAAKPTTRPGIKTPLFLLVMMMPAAGAAAVLAARRK